MNNSQLLRRVPALVLVFVGLASLSGCVTYYQVTDPTSDKVYYTTEVRHEKNGATKLKDGKTGSKVTIQNSEVKPITQEEFETGRLK